MPAIVKYRIKGTTEVIEMPMRFLIDPAFPRIVEGRLLSDGTMQCVYDVQLEPIEREDKSHDAT